VEAFAAALSRLLLLQSVVALEHAEYCAIASCTLRLLESAEAPNNDLTALMASRGTAAIAFVWCDAAALGGRWADTEVLWQVEGGSVDTLLLRACWPPEWEGGQA
jgi:hypothetical protein